MSAHIPGKFRRWLLRWLGVDATVAAMLQARAWTPTPPLHATVYDAQPERPITNPLQHPKYIAQIHTQHGLPAIRARRVIPAKIWSEQHKQQGKA